MHVFYRSFIIVLLAIGFLNTPSFASSEPSEMFITSVTSEALDILKNAKNPEEREAAFGRLLDTRTNMKRIAKFTLGRSARTISDDEFNRFQSVLGDTMVKIYANRLAGFTDEKVVVTGSQTKGRNHLVTSRVEFANSRPPVDMVWWVIEEKDGSFALFDIQVLGVWMAQEQRDIFSGILKSNNNKINALIEHLAAQVKTTP